MYFKYNKKNDNSNSPFTIPNKRIILKNLNIIKRNKKKIRRREVIIEQGKKVCLVGEPGNGKHVNINLI